MDIKHAGHTIKPEPIELVLVHPETQIAQQEPHYFMMAIVEQPAVPLVMSTLATTMEVLMVSAVELVQTIENVL
jgi:hypothetical protein